MNGGSGELTGRPGLGWQLDGYRLDAVLGAGLLSWVAVGTRPDGQRRAFKVAGPFPMAGHTMLTDALPTRAFPTLWHEFYSEGIAPRMDDTIDPLAILRQQWRKLNAVRDPALVPIEGPEPTVDRPWYRMPYLTPSRTLRSMLRAREPVPIAFAIALTRAVERLAADPNFKYHGDLKPENILVTPSGPVLLDPGYLGPLDEEPPWRGTRRIDSDVLVTTLAYNHLDRGDVGALRIILWEIACGRHPLSPILPHLQAGRVHSFDEAFVFLANLTRTGAGRTPDLLARTARDPELLDLLLPRFSTFADIRSALVALRDQGVAYLRICGDDSCASPGRHRCSRCSNFFCSDHSVGPTEPSGQDGWRCIQHSGLASGSS